MAELRIVQRYGDEQDYLVNLDNVKTIMFEDESSARIEFIGDDAGSSLRVTKNSVAQLFLEAQDRWT